MSTGPLFTLRLEPGVPLGLQVEQRIRALIRSHGLPVGAGLPSTRSLAADLAVSRGVVVGAYAQLAAEGYIALRRGAAPTVALRAREPEHAPAGSDVAIAGVRYNLRPDLPDLALFPRRDWLAASRSSLGRAVNHDLAYGEPFGAAELRREVAPFLARTRGVVATPERTGVFAGSTQALFTVASVLREQGARRIAVEDPGHRWRTRALAATGLEIVPVPVDDDGLCVDLLGDVSAVVVSPDRHFPLGVALSPERRRALVEWAAGGDRIVLEHDYDGHFRYDRPAAGTLQGLAPEHVVYVGGASALLAPTLRIGWAVLPARLVVPVANRTFATGIATPRLSQLALADLIASGSLDRHLRRARTAYRRRREVLLAALGRHFPDATVSGVAAGLSVALALPETDEAALLAAARARGFALDGINEHALHAQPQGLAIGFAAAPEPTLQRAIQQLASLRAGTG
jgi:GntR family transcriptional regulator / MocR family aminotransferase